MRFFCSFLGTCFLYFLLLCILGCVGLMIPHPFGWVAFIGLWYVVYKAIK